MMIARYRFEELVTELTEIQEFVSWGMTCNDQRVSYMYNEDMTKDSNKLRSVSEMLNSKFASCLEFSVLMKQYSIKFGVPCIQGVLQRTAKWSMHGVIMIGNHTISMGNYIEVIDDIHSGFIEIEFNSGESRKCMYERMLAKL